MEVSYLFYLVGAAFLGWWFLRRRRRVQVSYRAGYLLIWTGMAFQSLPIKEVAEGVAAPADGVIYPADVLQRLNAGQLPFHAKIRNVPVYFLAIEPVELARHRALEEARKTIAIRALFAGGGDILHWLTVAALIVPLIVSVLFWGQIGGLQQSIARIEARVERLVAPSPAESGE